jgi:Protein of unknown function (DUF3349)
MKKVGEPVPLNTRLRGVLDWLLEGYPAGVPPKDYIPLIALLRRQLTEEEVRDVADEVALRSPKSVSTDIGVSITRITDALPSQEEVARVEEGLGRHGWPPDA